MKFSKLCYWEHLEIRSQEKFDKLQICFWFFDPNVEFTIFNQFSNPFLCDLTVIAPETT